MNCLYHLIYYESKNIGFSNFEVEDEKEYELQEVNGEVDIQNEKSIYHIVIKDGKAIVKCPLMEKEIEIDAQVKIQRGKPVKRKDYYNKQYKILANMPNLTFRPPIPPGPFRHCDKTQEEQIRPYILKIGVMETEYCLENNIIGSGVMGKFEIGIPKIIGIHITFKMKE